MHIAVLGAWCANAFCTRREIRVASHNLRRPFEHYGSTAQSINRVMSDLRTYPL